MILLSFNAAIKPLRRTVPWFGLLTSELSMISGPGPGGGDGTASGLSGTQLGRPAKLLFVENNC